MIENWKFEFYRLSQIYIYIRLHSISRVSVRKLRWAKSIDKSRCCSDLSSAFQISVAFHDHFRWKPLSCFLNFPQGIASEKRHKSCSCLGLNYYRSNKNSLMKISNTLTLKLKTISNFQVNYTCKNFCDKISGMRYGEMKSEHLKEADTKWGNAGIFRLQKKPEKVIFNGLERCCPYHNVLCFPWHLFSHSCELCFFQRASNLFNNSHLHSKIIKKQ